MPGALVGFVVFDDLAVIEILTQKLCTLLFEASRRGRYGVFGVLFMRKFAVIAINPDEHALVIDEGRSLRLGAILIGGDFGHDILGGRRRRFPEKEKQNQGDHLAFFSSFLPSA